MTVRLNARLAQIASYIQKGESVCDIGTDHGFLPIWLEEQGGYGKVIMSDVSRGSLDKAVCDAKEELGEDGIPDARLGDGLDVLEKGEVDDVVIAGMGGIQILDILSWDMSKALSFHRYIFQPRRDAALLRKWLIVNGFDIQDQTVVPENGRYSEIICAVTDKAVSSDLYFYERETVSDLYEKDPEGWMELEYPDDLRDPSGRGTDRAYFSSELDKAREIVRKIREKASPQNEKLDIMSKRIDRLEELCRKKNS